MPQKRRRGGTMWNNEGGMNFKNIAYWALIIFLAAIFVMVGVGKLTQMEAWQDPFVNQWNLPAWLAPITGVAEILGGLMLLIPKLTTLGAAVIVMVMLGATGTHIMA
ncbi:MAG: DoxX family protein, partial [Acidobacteria bacterium]|nr:DoxX family protein [Acidobacteriota bacterium]